MCSNNNLTIISYRIRILWASIECPRAPKFGKLVQETCFLSATWPTVRPVFSDRGFGTLAFGWSSNQKPVPHLRSIPYTHVQIFQDSNAPRSKPKNLPVTNLPQSSQPPPKTSPTSSSTPRSPVPSPRLQASNTKKKGKSSHR